jgi:hypothetical protein
MGAGARGSGGGMGGKMMLTRAREYAMNLFKGDESLFQRVLIAFSILFMALPGFAGADDAPRAGKAGRLAEGASIDEKALAALGFKPLSKAKEKSFDAIYNELKSRTFPVDVERASLLNPWGESLSALTRVPSDFGRRAVAAAKVYSDQNIRFDGYMGSDDDGMHYTAAADGADKAYYGDTENKTYYVVCNREADDLSERAWVCLDFPVHTLTLAGFPLREAMIADFQEADDLYTLHGMFPKNRPANHWFFRRVPNLKRYFSRQQFYSEDRITAEQYRDPAFTPREPILVGDILFLGHYGDDDGAGPWSVKHSGIVASVDKRGLPVMIYNMRVSSKMYDDYDGVIDQTRTIGGKQVYFERFSDRYSLAAHGRIVHPFVDIPNLRPDGGQRVREARIAGDDSITGLPEDFAN